MFKPKEAFNTCSVDDLEKARAFYVDVLGLRVDDEGGMGLNLHLPGGRSQFIYPKDDHQPATFTILNFVVDDIEDAMDDLKGKGVRFERYDREDLPQDEKGVARGLRAGMGPDIAWFTDPAGNVLSVMQTE